MTPSISMLLPSAAFLCSSRPRHFCAPPSAAFSVLLPSAAFLCSSRPRQLDHCRGTMTLVASFAQWVEGARPRTLPNAIAPVIAGTGGAAWLHAACWWKAMLALLVAVAMIIGVNYANDYSDGIRGTYDVRSGPLRLVGSKLASPRSGRSAAGNQPPICAAPRLAPDR